MTSTSARRQDRPDAAGGPKRSNEDVLAALTRLVRAYARRDGVDVLAGLDELAALVDLGMHDCVARLRSYEGGEHSWAEIGSALGVTRQSAQERFAKAGGTRLPGGQPSRLR